MHQLIPVSRLIEHLGDKGFLTTSQVLEFQTKATQLVLSGYTENVIIEALFNGSSPELRVEIDRYQETPAEHLRMSHIMISKEELLTLLLKTLNGEHSEIESVFATIHDSHLLSVNQAIYLIPRHHPKTIDTVVAIYLSRAREIKGVIKQYHGG